MLPDIKLRFLSSNKFKIAEVDSILTGYTIIPVNYKIEELQTTDVEALVRDKCVKAFRAIGYPVFVEHTGLFLDSLNGFPGGLTQIFWDTLQADIVSSMFGGLANPVVIAKTRIAYCDGKTISQFEGEIKGKIASVPRGDRDFQWDCVFVPDGYTETFAELGQEKNKISMRKAALDKFSQHLKALK